MTKPVEVELRQFFDAFGDASTRQDWEAYGGMFLEHFLNIDPMSTSTIARDDLIAFLPRRKAFFDQAHATGTRLASLAVETLDDRHAIARTTWDVIFDQTVDEDRDRVVLRTTFLLRKEDDWRIAVYLNHAVLAQLLGLGA